MREAATCRRGNENAGLGTNRFLPRYLRRFPKDMPFELIEIPAGKRGKNADIKRILDKEGEQMLAAAGKNRIVTLDIPGKPWDTPQLAAELERWKLDGRDVSLLIGGPEGLSPACKAAAEQSWSLSALTLPIRWFARAGRRESVPGVEHHQPTILITVSDKGALSENGDETCQNSFRDYTAESALFVRRALVAFWGFCC